MGGGWDPVPQWPRLRQLGEVPDWGSSNEGAHDEGTTWRQAVSGWLWDDRVLEPHPADMSSDTRRPD